MLLHLVLVAVRTTGMTMPKAVLAELVAVALLASVPEAHHALTVAVGALHGVEDLWRAGRQGRGKAGEREGQRTRNGIRGREKIIFIWGIKSTQ